MKKRFLFLLGTVFAAVTAAGFASCKKNDDVPPDPAATKTAELPADPVSKEYTGERLYADVTENEAYTIINEGGVNAGEYSVIYRLKEGYAWADNTTAPVIKNFSILTAENSWLEAITAVDWEYGESANVTAKAKFGGVYYEWYKGNAKLPGLPVDAGEYSVLARVDETNDFTGLVGEKKTVRIRQAKNEWQSLFAGGETEFRNDYSALAKAKFGEVVFEWFTTAGEAISGNPVKAGAYKVAAKVAATANYAGLESEKISVTLVKAQNAWTKEFAAENSEWGEELKLSAAAKAGEVKYRYFNAEGEPLSEKPSAVGEYFAEAYVEETEAYSALTSARKAFEIKRKQVDLTYLPTAEVLLAENKRFDFDTIAGENIGSLKIGENGEKIAYGAGVTLSKDNAKSGVHTVYLYNEAENTVYALNVRFLTDKFTQADAGRIFEAINADPGGYYALGGDIDFAGKTHSLSSSSYGYDNYMKGVKPTAQAAILPAFSGTLDGCGYAMKNLKIKSVSTGNYSTATVFGEVTGEIKNVYIQLSDVTELKCNGARGLIFAMAGGKVNNVLLDWTVSKYELGNSSGWYPCGGIASIFAGGEIKNNLVLLGMANDEKLQRYAEMLEVNSTFGAFVGQKTPSAPDAVKNNYAVSALAYYTAIGGAADKTGCFASMSELLENADFVSENGWNALWKKENGALKFGEHGLNHLENAWLKELTANSIVEGETLEYYAKAKWGKVTYEWKRGDEILSGAPEKEGEYTLIARVAAGDFYGSLEKEITVKIGKKIEKIAGEKVIEVNGSHYNFDLLAGDAVTHIALSSAEEDKIAYSETFRFDNNFAFRGNASLYLYTSGGVKCINAVFADKAFTQADAATIWKTLNDAPNGYYVLSGNIDFSAYPIEKNTVGFGAQGGGRSQKPSAGNCAVYQDFTGTFDGRGYGLYNLQLKATGTANYTTVSVFGVVKGEIKNMYVQLIDRTDISATVGSGTMNAGNGGRSFSYRIDGLYGSINNILLDWTLQRYDLGNSTNYYPAGGITTVLVTKDGARNNIVKMRVVNSEKLDEISGRNSRSSLGGVAGQASYDCSAYLGTNYVIGNVSYLSLVGVHTWGENTNTFKTTAAFIESAKTLNPADGWGRYWSLGEGLLAMGEENIESKENRWIAGLTAKNVPQGEPLEIAAYARFGEVKYRYFDGEGNLLSEVPTAIGDYEVQAYVEATEEYTGIESEKAAFAIEKRLTRLTSEILIDLSQNAHFDFSSLLNIGAVTHIAFGYGESDKLAYNAEFTFGADTQGVTSGVKDMYLYTEAENYVIYVTIADKAFGQSDATTLVEWMYGIKYPAIFAAMNANPGGYFVLKESLEFSDDYTFTGGTQGGTPFTNYGGLNLYHALVFKPFTGVFDGRGFALKNLRVGYSATANGNVAVFGNVTGEIKNAFVELVDATASDKCANAGVSLIFHVTGEGKVQNVAMQWKIRSYAMGSQSKFMTGAIAHFVRDSGAIENCIVNVTAAEDTAEPTSYLAGVLGGDWRDASHKQYVKNNYVISAKIKRVTGENDANAEADRCYENGAAFFAGVSALSESDGWCKYWKIENGALKFGAETLVSGV